MALQLHLKPKTLTLTLTLPLRSICPFSSSNGGGGEGDSDPSSSPPLPSYACSFRFIKERLRSLQAPPRRIPTNPPPPPPLSKPSPPPSIADISKRLANFRLKSAPVNPASSSTPPISFQEISKSNALPKTQTDGRSDLLNLDSIRESLRRFKASPADQPRGRHRHPSGSFNINAFRESLRGGPAERGDDAAPLLRSEGRLPQSIFGKEFREEGEGEGEGDKEKASRKTEFLKMYGYDELGEKLRKLRPDEAGKGKTGWFSLQELNERLVKLRELEFKEPDFIMNFDYSELRASLAKTAEVEAAKKAANQQKTSFFLTLGMKTAAFFMYGKPQQHLIENYFHPDDMSLTEKMKLELQKVIDEFKMSESDCGSARVQGGEASSKGKEIAD